MQYTRLDYIVREALLSMRYPIHYYFSALTYAVECFRDFNFNVLDNTKSSMLPISNSYAVTLPSDFVSMIRVGHIANGQFSEWLLDESIPHLINRDSTGNPIPFPASDLVTTDYIADQLFSTGENLGRIFNHGAGYTPYRYNLFQTRNEIQLASTTSDKQIVLDYITDGMTLDASNTVHPLAINAIKYYIFWQFRLHKPRLYSGPEIQKHEDLYYNELRKLKAGLNPLSVEDIIRISREGLSAIPKQ
jgi:hypothetical protein